MDRIAIADRVAVIRRSEVLQRESWRLLSEGALRSAPGTLGIRVEERNSELYQGAAAISGAQFNKIFAFGMDDRITDERLAFARDWLTRHCAPKAMLMVPPCGPDPLIDEEFARQGFGRHPLDIAIFGLSEPKEPSPARTSGVEARAVSAEESGLFGRTLCEGLGNTPETAPAFAALVGQPGVTAYLARDGEDALGAAAVYRDGDWAWLFIAATRPGLRRLGAQTALLQRRIADGRADGVRTFVVGALCPAPGHEDVFGSYRNIQRAGFELLYRRPNYVLAG